MGQEIKSIRKQFRITRQEEKQIKEMMREQKVDSFSEFLRQNLLKKNYQDRIFESWFSLWQSQKFEQISRDVYEVLVVARENHQVTQEHVSILLTCVQELIAEVNQSQPLSREFCEKYIAMVYRYRTNLKKVFLTDSELNQLNDRITKSHCQNFSVYARKVLLNPNMSFITINTDTYDQLVFELRRIGNNINQIARAINQSHLISQDQLQELSKGVGELIKEVDKEFQVEVKRLKEFYGSY